MIELVVVAGMSGAGRSSVAAALEDLGWFVIDNMPPSLIPKVVDLAEGKGDTTSMALVVGREVALAQDELRGTLAHLKGSMSSVRLVFLEASDEALLQRYEGTKRRHPVIGEGGVLESVQMEREMLSGIKDLADIVIDTSELSVHQLKDRVVEAFATKTGSPRMRVMVNSFGYKHGLPRDSDLVFDCRFLPNPYWDIRLRELTGRDEAVRQYLESSAVTKEYLEHLGEFFKFVVPNFEKEGKSYLSVSIGCTGGRHRSVFLAEEIAALFGAYDVDVSVRHRDIDK